MSKDVPADVKPFLRVLQETQDEFADLMGALVVTTDKEGEVVTEMSGVPEPCKMIRDTEKGLKGCQESYKSALSLINKRKKPYIGPCHANFTSIWVPIKIDGEVVGSITGCGGLPEKKDEEEIREEYGELADDLGIEDKEKFVELVIDKERVPPEEEIKRRISLLQTSVTSLVRNTPLKKMFV